MNHIVTMVQYSNKLIICQELWHSHGIKIVLEFIDDTVVIVVVLIQELFVQVDGHVYVQFTQIVKCVFTVLEITIIPCQVNLHAYFALLVKPLLALVLQHLVQTVLHPTDAANQDHI